MRKFETFKSRGRYNSLWYWSDEVSPLKVIFNCICMKVAQISPSLKFKNYIYHLMGINIGKYVSVGFETTMDIFYPELIEIGDNTIIGYNTTILCHEFLINEYRIGKVKIGKNVTIGANTTILAGVTIADGSIVSAHSLVNSDVSGFVGGVPARQL